MAIEKTVRTITDKTTTVEDKIELSQKGEVSSVYIAGRAAGVLAIPTNIPNPHTVTLVPKNKLTGKVLQRWYCDYNLYPVTEATLAKLLALASTATVGSLASDVDDVMVSYNGKLYVGTDSGVGSSQLGSPSLVVGSSSLFKQVPWIASGESKLLKLIFHSVATVASLSKADLKFKYEVKGY